MSLAEKIKKLRWERNWTQKILSEKTGIIRSHISLIELGNIKKPGPDIFLKLAHGFNVAIEKLYEAAGYEIAEFPVSKHQETHEELIERLRLTSPVSIPLYKRFPCELNAFEIDRYVYRSRETMDEKKVEAYRVQCDCGVPIIDKGDVAIVDRDLVGSPGDVVLCLKDGEEYCGTLMMEDSDLYVNGSYYKFKLQECQLSAVIIQINKRLK